MIPNKAFFTHPNTNTEMYFANEISMAINAKDIIASCARGVNTNNTAAQEALFDRFIMLRGHEAQNMNCLGRLYGLSL